MARKIRNNQITQRRPAVVLLMSLLFMAAITASSVGVALVINNSLTLSRNTDNYITASLVADSGIERGLATISAARKNPNIVIDDAKTCAGTTVGAPCDTASQPVFTGHALSVRSNFSLQPAQKERLEANETLTYDLFVNAPRFIRARAVCNDSPCKSSLEVAWSLMTSSGISAYSNRQYLNEGQYEAATPLCIDLKNVFSESGNTAGPYSGSAGVVGYRISVRAITGPVENLSVTAYSDLGCQFENPAPGRIRLESVGTSGGGQSKVQSIKTADVLWQLPSPDVFNYVLFSEEDLIP